MSLTEQKQNALDTANTTGNNALVTLNYVHKNYGKQKVLRGLNLKIMAGSITGLLGPSGCGKTTLVNLIVGNTRPSAGHADVLGEAPPYKHSRRQIGFMPQDEALYNDLTAAQNLRFFGTLYGLKALEMRARIPELLNLMRLQDSSQKLVASFSGGMKRRLSLAIALMHRPRLLVLDEPTVGLDPELRLELWGEFRKLANQDTGLLITTHVMDEAASCDEVVMLHDGVVLARGNPSDLVRQAGVTSLEAVYLALEGGIREVEENNA